MNIDDKMDAACGVVIKAVFISFLLAFLALFLAIIIGVITSKPGKASGLEINNSPGQITFKQAYAPETVYQKLNNCEGKLEILYKENNRTRLRLQELESWAKGQSEINKLGICPSKVNPKVLFSN